MWAYFSPRSLDPIEGYKMKWVKSSVTDSKKNIFVQLRKFGRTVYPKSLALFYIVIYYKTKSKLLGNSIKK